jgi:hypothetical protein
MVHVSAPKFKGGVKTSRPFVLPIELGGKAKTNKGDDKATKEGKMEEIKRRVVTYLPPPMVSRKTELQEGKMILLDEGDLEEPRKDKRTRTNDPLEPHPAKKRQHVTAETGKEPNASSTVIGGNTKLSLTSVENEPEYSAHTMSSLVLPPAYPEMQDAMSPEVARE